MVGCHRLSYAGPRRSLSELDVTMMRLPTVCLAAWALAVFGCAGEGLVLLPLELCPAQLAY